MSLYLLPDDKLEQQHALFTRYKDPCRLGPGEEKPWAIGEPGLSEGWGIHASTRNTLDPSTGAGILFQGTPPQDSPMSPGTLLEINGLYDEDVCTPDNLQK